MGLPDKQTVGNSVILHLGLWGVWERTAEIALRRERLEMSRSSRKREHRGVTTMK